MNVLSLKDFEKKKYTRDCELFVLRSRMINCLEQLQQIKDMPEVADIYQRLMEEIKKIQRK